MASRCLTFPDHALIGMGRSPAAISFTLLGGVESLLSAKVADGMTGRKHRSNMELVAQGIANVASSFLAASPLRWTIARTATNIRAGARSPFSGILHSAFLLVFMLVAAPLANFIPLAALAGVLVVVSWNMAEKYEFVVLLRDWRTAVVLLATFVLTLVEDLTAGIVAGCVLGAIFRAVWASAPQRRRRLDAEFSRHIRQITAEHIDRHAGARLPGPWPVLVRPGDMAGTQAASGRCRQIARMRRHHHALLRLEIQGGAGGEIDAWVWVCSRRQPLRSRSRPRAVHCGGRGRPSVRYCRSRPARSGIWLSGA